MKQAINSLAILFVLTMFSVIFPKQTSAQQTDVNFQVFYDELSPYGQWVDYKNYGYAWIPDAGPDFAPYSTDGHWVLSDYGWTWVSNYEWGWAPFHYGRWDYDNYYGWLWVPDNEWGPSWVNWRRADGYYGWSPMEPGISLNISFSRPYSSSNDHWMFVRDRDFERPEINRYYVNRTDHDRIIRNSTVIRTTHIDNNRHTTYVTGPARADVQRITGHQIKPVSIRENSKPGQQMNNGQLQIYRPQINKNNNNERKPVPTRITNLKDVKRPAERSRINQQRTTTPTNNDRQQPPNVARPQNNRNVQPAQQPAKTAAPANNSGRQQQPNVAKPQNNSNAKPAQQSPKTAAPANNSGRQQQPNVAKPQNSSNVKPARQPAKTAAPARQQPNAVRPQNTGNTQPSQQQQRQQQQQPRSATPANNNGGQQQQLQQRQQQQLQQQQRSATPPANNVRSQQQPKESKPEQDKKRND